MANTIIDPWMVISDYNNVLTVADIIGGCPVQEVKYVDLEDMMKEVGLFEHSTHGNHHTWSNKQNNGTIYSRIYRAICNS